MSKKYTKKYVITFTGFACRGMSEINTHELEAIDKHVKPMIMLLKDFYPHMDINIKEEKAIIRKENEIIKPLTLQS